MAVFSPLLAFPQTMSRALDTIADFIYPAHIRGQHLFETWHLSILLLYKSHLNLGLLKTRRP
jgi:hypothetical protein